jgi:hypothetical protein
VTVELATASYRSFIPQMGIAVATSLGRPKWPLSYELVEEVHALKPWGLMEVPDSEFNERFRARLEKTGVAKLQRVFHAISGKHKGQRLVLLCHEQVLGPKAKCCHRRDWAEWWRERTGQVVPELSWIAGPGGVPVVVHEVNDTKEQGDGAPISPTRI